MILILFIFILSIPITSDYIFKKVHLKFQVMRGTQSKLTLFMNGISNNLTQWNPLFVNQGLLWLRLMQPSLLHLAKTSRVELKKTTQQTKLLFLTQIKVSRVNKEFQDETKKNSHTFDHALLKMHFVNKHSLSYLRNQRSFSFYISRYNYLNCLGAVGRSYQQQSQQMYQGFQRYQQCRPRGG